MKLDRQKCARCGVSVPVATFVNFDYYEDICRGCLKDLRGEK